MAEINIDDSKLKVSKINVSEVDVKSGEEDEVTIFVHRSKLYLFVKEDVYGGEKRENYWKERGLGDVKIQKHKLSGKCRLLMRQEKTMKVCSNHYISPSTEITVHQDTDKACVFTTNDYATGEVVEQTYTMRFKTADVTERFMKAYKDAQASNKELVSTSEKASEVVEEVVEEVVKEVESTKDSSEESVPELVSKLIDQIKTSDWLEKQMKSNDKEKKNKSILDIPEEVLAKMKGEDVVAAKDDKELESLLCGLVALTTKDEDEDQAEKFKTILDPLQVGLNKMLDEQNSA